MDTGCALSIDTLLGPSSVPADNQSRGLQKRDASQPKHNPSPTGDSGSNNAPSPFDASFAVGDVFDFLRRPADLQPAFGLEEIKARANEYFTRCADHGIYPNLSGLALALGLPSAASVERLGRRRPEVRQAISNCITALSFYQEHGMIHGQVKPQVGTFLLKHLQAFDTEEPEGAPPVRFWDDSQRHTVEVTGVVEHRAGQDMTPEEAYLFVLNGGRLPEKVVNNLLEEKAEDAEIEEYFND